MIDRPPSALEQNVQTPIPITRHATAANSFNLTRNLGLRVFAAAVVVARTLQTNELAGTALRDTERGTKQDRQLPSAAPALELFSPHLLPDMLVESQVGDQRF